MGRKRNLNLHVRLTKEEKDLIESIVNLKNITLTELIIELTKNEYEKIKEENNGR